MASRISPASQQLRTLPPSAFNQNPISPFPISRMPSSSQLRSQNGSQPQTPLTAGPQDVFGSNPIFPSNLASASSSAHNTNQNATTSSADYFSRPLPALHDQSAPRLTNLTPDPTLNNDNNSTSGSVLGINSLAVQSFSQDLCPPRVGLMQPRTSYSNGTGMGMQQDGMNGTGAGSGMQMDGMMDLNGMPGTTGTTTSTPGLIEEVEKARNVHG